MEESNGKKISASKTKEEYYAINSTEEFPTLYMYALYVCGGDFSLFDNIDGLIEKEEHKEEKQLICVLCGTPWGVKNIFTNNCENPECSGFCSWGHEMNKPLSFTVKDDGKWVPNAPKTFGEELAEGMDKDIEFTDFMKDKSTADPVDYRKQIRDGSHFIATKFFDFEKIFNFCQEHRVEVLLQEDTMMHCFIDYHLDDNKNKSSWAIEFDGFTALIRGIHEYTNRHPD